MAGPTGAGLPISGAYGYIAVYDGTLNSGTGGYFILDNATYEIEVGLNSDPITAMGSANSPVFETMIHRSNAVRNIAVSLPEDDPSSLEISAFVQNKAYTLWLRRGACSTTNYRWDKVANAIFTGIRKINRASDGMARRVEALFEKGDYIPSIPSESALSSYLTGIGRG